MRAKRGVEWYGPGIERHPSSSSSSPTRIRQHRVRHERRAGLPVVEDEEPERQSRPAGRPDPTPGAATIVSTMSSKSVRSDGPNSVDRLRGLAEHRVAQRSDSKVHVGLLVQVRLGLDTIDDAISCELTEPRPERAHPLGVEGEQAYRPTSRGRDEERDGIERAELGLEIRRTRPRGRRRRRPGRPASTASARFLGVEPIRVPSDQGLHDRVSGCRGLHDRSSRGGVPSRPPPSTSPGSARAPRARASDQRGRHRGSPRGPGHPRPRSRTIVRPADQDLVRAGQSGGLVIAEPSRPARARPVPAHSSTCSAPPRRTPKDVPPQDAAAPGSPADDARDGALGGAEEPTARCARRRLAAGPADLCDAVAGERREHEPPTRGRERPDQPRRAAGRSGPHHLDRGPPLVPRATPWGVPAPRPPPTGTRRQARRRRRSKPAPCERDVTTVVVRGAVLPMGGVALARHVDETHVIERGEHGGARPDHDVVPARSDLEPASVPRRVCPRRGTTPPGLRTHRAAWSRSPGPASPPARGRSPGDRRRGTPLPRRRRRDCSSSGAGRSDEGALDPRASASSSSSSTPIAGERPVSPRGSHRDPSTVRPVPPIRSDLLGRHPGRDRSPDHRRERRDVPFAHPAESASCAVVEESDGRDDLPDGEHPGWERRRWGRAPSHGRAPVEGHLHERADARLELGGQVVGERSVERQQRTIDADADRAGEALSRRARRRSSARSVPSQGNSLRPKWP